AFEHVIEERRKAGDPKLVLVPGRDLLGEEMLPDGIHPGDAGHAEMARVLGPILAGVSREGDVDA
ncbi:MAG: GDSL family lipase, partial [Myxococcota bacterium]